jgi:hypothetical protein
LLIFGSLALSSACVRFASSAGLTSAASLISSASSSEILSSPFRSSSGSSGSEETRQREQEQQHEEEIKIYTASYLAGDRAAGDGFTRGLSVIAWGRGISDWESSPTTWIGVGRGLAAAGLRPQLVAGYAQSWSDGNPDILVLLEQGYALARDGD